MKKIIVLAEEHKRLSSYFSFLGRLFFDQTFLVSPVKESRGESLGLTQGGEGGKLLCLTLNVLSPIRGN